MLSLMAKMDTIEVDEVAAAQLRSRAAERGVSVSELLTELLSLDAIPDTVGTEDIADLDRRWAAINAGGATVPNEDVIRWLRTWGTPAFRRWHER
jgi:predicted transcriptional regulator